MEENHNKKTQEEWFALIEEHKNSKLSHAIFCKEKNIKPHQLGYYRRQYYLKSAESKPEFSSVVFSQTKNNVSSEIKIELPNGFICYIPGSIQSVNLKKLIGVLLSC
jgi:hypothetical protein